MQEDVLITDADLLERFFPLPTFDPDGGWLQCGL
jgi:hypothetical protein